MLTDAFVYRYQNTRLRDEFTQKDQALMMQGFRLCFEQVFPFWVDGKENPRSKIALQQVHDRLTMELGLSELSSKYYAYQTTWHGKPHTVTGTNSLDSICKTWICKPYDSLVSASRFLAERISFFELTFRTKEEEVSSANESLPQRILDADTRSKEIRGYSGSVTLPGNLSDSYRAVNARINFEFRQNVEELNTRFRQAGYNLNYHNGLIQLADDVLSTHQIEKPFWEITSDALWKNVDIDMKEAIDRRDNGGRDPSFYAAKALESAIKIISDRRGVTRNTERGAADYIDNLVSVKNGRFIEVWESEALKAFFSKVRNPFGHGPGDGGLHPVPKTPS